MLDSWQIDTRRFAERGERIDQQLTVAQLPRLRQECVGPFEPVDVSVLGVRSPRGKPGVRVALRAAIRVRCQRCLKPMAIELTPVSSFEWVSTEAELDAGDKDDEWDSVIASTLFDLVPLLEDELLLAVPYAALHPACNPTGATEAGEKLSPFAALSGLKALK